MAAMVTAAGLNGMEVLTSEDPLFVSVTQLVAQRTHAINRSIEGALARNIGVEFGTQLNRALRRLFGNG